MGFGASLYLQLAAEEQFSADEPQLSPKKVKKSATQHLGQVKYFW